METSINNLAVVVTKVLSILLNLVIHKKMFLPIKIFLLYFRHAGEICNMALDLKAACGSIVRPDIAPRTITIQAGVHTGNQIFVIPVSVSINVIYIYIYIYMIKFII